MSTFQHYKHYAESMKTIKKGIPVNAGESAHACMQSEDVPAAGVGTESAHACRQAVRRRACSRCWH